MPPYQPDTVFIDGDGLVYLHSPADDKIFRYSIDKGRYLSPIALGAGSAKVAYAAAERRVYVGYADGTVTRIDLDQGLLEEPFANLGSGPPTGLAVVDGLLFAVTDDAQRLLAPDGTLLQQRSGWYAGRSEELVWSAPLQRVYRTDNGSSPSDVYWLAVDTAAGALGASGESPYSGDVPVFNPIRISDDGASLVTGAGLVYDAATLVLRDAIPVDPADALWVGDELITLSATVDGKTQLDHWDAGLNRFNQVEYEGTPVRVLPHPGGFVVVTQSDTRPRFHLYVPSNDADGDGVPNPDDAFPSDPSASVDSDLDGYPDAWNAGYDAGDSSLGLVLDAFPLDSACWLAEQGSGGVCDIAASIPDFDPDGVEVGTDDIVYLLAADAERVFRYSLAEGRYLDPIVLHGRPLRMAYSASRQRLYLAYPNRALTVIELGAGLDERPFATTFQAVTGIGVADPYIVVSDPSGNESHTVFAPDGTRISWNRSWRSSNSSHWAWSPLLDRLYFLRDDIIPDDLLWEAVDPATGAITAQADSPYHGDLQVTGPIRLSPDETRVMLGSGDVYDTVSLQVLASIPVDPVDIAWPASDELLTLRAAPDGSTVLDHWDADLGWYNGAHFAGAPRRVLPWSGGVAVMTLDGGRVRFESYVASNDADGDGVPNPDDRFPFDPAASLDSDGDGYPDAWNPGAGPDDSTTGLVLDAFPDDSACWLPAHGVGGVCDIAARIPAFLPDRVEIGQGDVVYLLSLAQGRIYRWSADLEAYLDPIVLEPGAVTMAYAPELDRIYVGYADGRIEWIDPQAPAVVRPFAVLHNGMGSLTPFAGLLYAQDGYPYYFDYSFAADGSRVFHDMTYWKPESFLWSPAMERLYFTCLGNCSPDDIRWLSADPISGEVAASEGDSPYHATIDVENPIRIEPNGDRMLDGTGQLWDAYSLEIIGSLGEPLVDAHWGADRLLILRDDGSGGTRVDQLDSATLTDWGSETLSGAPLRVLRGSNFYVVLTQQNGSVALERYVPPNDADGDGVPNVDDAFSLDPAASVDSDGDGWPDAWNPGYGPEDSTTGLELDAFPQDFACQRPEEGVGGVCDFALVVPPDPSEPLCSQDDLGTAAPSGALATGAAVDLVPLCNGWFAYGDTDNDRLVVQNAFSGRLGLVVRLPRTPVDLLLDPDTKRIYVTMNDWGAVDEVDLVTGAIREHPAPDRAWHLYRDLGSHLIVAAETGISSLNREVYRLDLTTDALEGPVAVRYQEAVWNPQRQELIARPGSGRLERYAIDFAAGSATLLEEAYWGWYATSLALSPDGTQVAYGTDDLNNESIAHYASDDLQTVLGVWPDANYPAGMAFDGAGARLAVSSDVRLQVFDVASHQLLHTFTVPSCTDGQLGAVGFSRGGALAFVKQDCGPSAESAQFHWLRVD